MAHHEAQRVVLPAAARTRVRRPLAPDTQKVCSLSQDGTVGAGRPTPGTGDPGSGDPATEFRSILSAHHNVNATLLTDEPTEIPIVAYLRSQHIRPRSSRRSAWGGRPHARRHPLRIRVRHCLRTRRHRSPGRSRSRPLPSRRGDAAPLAPQRDRGDTHRTSPGALGRAAARVWVTATNMKSTVVRDGTVRIQSSAPWGTPRRARQRGSRGKGRSGGEENCRRRTRSARSRRGIRGVHRGGSRGTG